MYYVRKWTVDGTYSFYVDKCLQDVINLTQPFTVGKIPFAEDFFSPFNELYLKIHLLAVKGKKHFRLEGEKLDEQLELLLVSLEETLEEKILIYRSLERSSNHILHTLTNERNTLTLELYNRRELNSNGKPFCYTSSFQKIFEDMLRIRYPDLPEVKFVYHRFNAHFIKHFVEVKSYTFWHRRPDYDYFKIEFESFIRSFLINNSIKFSQNELVF